MSGLICSMWATLIFFTSKWSRGAGNCISNKSNKSLQVLGKHPLSRSSEYEIDLIWKHNSRHCHRKWQTSLITVTMALFRLNGMFWVTPVCFLLRPVRKCAVKIFSCAWLGINSSLSGSRLTDCRAQLLQDAHSYHSFDFDVLFLGSFLAVTNDRMESRFLLISIFRAEKEVASCQTSISFSSPGRTTSVVAM